MGSFLRDEFVKNISVDESALNQFNSFFEEKEKEINLSIGNMALQREKVVYLVYIIRFDKKGYRFHEFPDVINCYKEAKEVERIIFTLESSESASNSRLLGTHIELRFDSKDSKNSIMTISSDSRNLVDASFSCLSDIIKQHSNNNYLIRNNWTQFVVQIIGVVAGFIVSLWVAVKFSPHLQVQTPIVFSFLLAFLIFSNVWGYLNQQLLQLVNYSFPNIRFKRRKKDSVHWLLQALIGSIAVAVVLFMLEKIFLYARDVIDSIII